MKALLKSTLVFSFSALAGSAIANDTQTAAATPAKTELVTQLSQAVQQKDWYQSEKLAAAAIGTGKLSVNEKTAALNNLCIALALKRIYSEALDACSQSIALAPDRAGAYVNRGNLYAKLGKATLAKADYAKAQSLDPTSDVAERNIAAMRWKEEHSYVALIANYEN